MGMTSDKIPKPSHVPKKNSMTTSGEGGNASSSRAKSRKDKEILREDPIEEEVSHGSESEEVPAPKKKRVRAPEKKTPTPSEISRLLKAMDFMPTAYPDSHMLQRLGIYDDVKLLLENMGLKWLLTLQRPGYKQATYQFLSSLEATFHLNKENPVDGHGHIKFRIGRQTYQMSFKRISEVMGFPDRGQSRIGHYRGEIESLWSMIAARSHDTKGNKSKDIKNPALCYVQKVLASTLFARGESGRVVEDELRFLIIGIKPLIKVFEDKSLIHGGADNEHPGIVAIFVRRLLYYQRWAWTKRDQSPELSIGGLITPLLEAKSVPSPEADVGFELMDESFLTNHEFLDGRVGNSWVYSYKLPNKEIARTFLPNQSITSLVERDNIKFHLPEEVLYNPEIHEIPVKIITTDDPMEDDGTAVEEESVHTHRHSYHGDASATE
ncbi:hypothetical protein HID58_066822, partial [Brassica napus]